MRHYSLSLGICIAGLLTSVTAAQAGNESWVSGTGTDAGTCPRTAPCRTFQFAHDQTNNNGSINVLNSGNFGPVTITKPISIVADGVEAVINTALPSPNPAAIAINAGGGAVVSLRGLTIDMRGTANFGILFNSGAALHVRDTFIRRSNDGIRFAPAAGNPELYVADTAISGSQAVGIDVRPSGNGAVVTLDRVSSESNGDGAMMFRGTSTTGSVTATVRDSLAAFSGPGLQASDDGVGTTVVTLENSAVVNNAGAFGVMAVGAGAIIRMGDSTVSGNGQGLSTFTGGVIDSYGTNKVNGNGTDGTPTNTIGMK